MIPLFLTLILCGVILFLIMSIRLLRPSLKQIFTSPMYYAYLFQIIGILGLIFYGSEFYNKFQKSLSITLESSLPDLINAVAKLAWPFLGFFTALYLLPKILDFLNTVYEISIPGFNTTFKRAQNVQSGLSPIVEITAIPQYKDLSAYRKEVVTALQTKVRTINSSEQISQLILYAAVNSISADYEFIFGLIFGTQLDALRALLERPLNNLEAFFISHQEKAVGKIDKSNSPTYEKWISFLNSHQLILQSGESVSITDKGRDFLVFVNAMKTSFIRGF